MATTQESSFRRCRSKESKPDPVINLSIATQTESWVQPCRSDSGRRSAPSIPDELVREILSWLPAKSLMRFKCVSRLWRSIIQDPAFARAHRGGFRGVLVSAPKVFRLTLETDFYYLNIQGPRNSRVKLSHHLTVNHGGRRFGSTSAVNGLVCFYNCNHSYLFNIATREKLQLPVSTNESQACSYHLGFDPVNELYKLLKICPVYDDYNDDDIFADDVARFVLNLNCEILTIGVDSSWRSIDSTTWAIKSRSACYDGVLFWLEPIDRFGCPRRLIAFHLSEEKFQDIRLPEEVWGYIPHFGPGLAVINSSCGAHDIKTFEIRLPDGESGEWTRLEIIVEDEEDVFVPAGTLPDGKVLIFEDDHGIAFPLDIYLYDPTTGEWEHIVVKESPGYISGSGDMYYHEENIMPLSCLNSFL